MSSSASTLRPLSALAVIATIAFTGCLIEEEQEAISSDVSESQVGPSSSHVVNLHTWYSPSRNEYFSSANAHWHGSQGQTRSPDYRWVRIEGRIFRPDRPQPLETSALHLWWNHATRDNALSASLADETRLRFSGFERIRLEGYVFRRAVAGTHTLTAYQGPDEAVSAGMLPVASPHRFRRRLGYIYRPPYWKPLDLDLAKFGHSKFARSGTRPLLLIVQDSFPSRATTDNDLAFYENLVFGESNSVADYFSANSHRRFTFAKAGAIEVVTASDDDRSVLRMAGANFDFGAYDANRNGYISADELSILVINKRGGHRGTSRNVGCTRPIGNTVVVCPFATFVNEEAHLMKIVHELGRHLTMWDLGRGRSYNHHATGASNAQLPGNIMQTWQMDPWHKMAWGWVKPRVVSLAMPATVEPLYTPNTFGRGSRYQKRPVILYHPSKGYREFFMIEARSPDNAYDQNVADSGMAVWHIQLDNTSVPRNLVWRESGRTNQSWGIQLISGPNGAGEVGFRAGRGRFFRPEDGAIELKWADGSSARTTLQFKFTDASRTRGHVEIGRSFRARIDTSHASTRRGGVLNVRGVFSFQEGRRAFLSQPGGLSRWQLPIRIWNPEGGVQFQIPSSMPRGNFELYIDGPQSFGEWSNPIPIEIH